MPAVLSPLASICNTHLPLEFSPGSSPRLHLLPLEHQFLRHVAWKFAVQMVISVAENEKKEQLLLINPGCRVKVSSSRPAASGTHNHVKTTIFPPAVFASITSCAWTI